MKKIFLICPTYRDITNNISYKLRMFGLVSLINQMQNQIGEYDIKLCIIDSSITIHPFFEKYNNNLDNILYIHIPDRNNISSDIKKNYKTSIDNFILNDNNFNKKKWKSLIKKAVAWDNIFPWDKDYPIKNTIEEQINNNRPTIGMKRNFGISALTEKFGESDYILYTDDDDFRSNTYIYDLVKGMKNYDFGRFFKYYVFSIVDDCELYGINNIKIFKDANDNWLLSKQLNTKQLFNTTLDYKNTLQNKYSPLIGIAFPFISFEGATHIFKYSVWQQMLKYTNGIPITSICEDVLFFKNCKKYLGKFFQETNIKINEINFLRVNNGYNTSVIEWTKNIKYDNLPGWAMEVINNYKKIYNITDINSYYNHLYDNFILNNTIIF